MMRPQKHLPISQDDKGKKEMAGMLMACFESQKVYGKEPESMASALKVFNMVLADYSIKQIMDAFKFHLRNNAEMPTPSDIVKVIERGNKPPLSESVYVSLSKKAPEMRTSKDWEYIKEYEHFVMTGRM